MNAAPSIAPRPRSRRGEGAALREELIAAAAAMIAETQDVDQLTLRGVAKRVGIAAPSIYRHFPDVEHLAQAVVDRTFADFAAERDQSTDDGAPPDARLLRRCQAYCHFALDHPGAYRFMFSPRRPPTSSPTGMATFAALVQSIEACHDTGLATATEPAPVLAAQVWAALHGLVVLRLDAPFFPWPAPLPDLVDHTVRRLVGLGMTDPLRPPAPRRSPSTRRRKP